MLPYLSNLCTDILVILLILMLIFGFHLVQEEVCQEDLFCKELLWTSSTQ